MFERFSESAHRAVVVASEEARALRHPSIDTVHLLVSVLVVDEHIAGVVAPFGVSAEAARAELAPGDAEYGPQLPFTPPAKDALEGALRESLELRARVIVPAHLLLALIAAPRVGALIRNLGAEPARVRDAVLMDLAAQRRRPELPTMRRSFVEDLTLALRRAEELARRDGRPVDAGHLLLALGVSPLVAYAIRTTGLAE